MTKDEALRLALETLEAIHTQGDVACVVTPNGEIYIKPVITAVKAALEAKAEPVVWNEGVPAMLPKQKEGETFIVSYEPKLEAKDEPVGTAGELFSNTALERLDLRPSTNIYITPPQRKPLTDEEIERIWESLPFCNGAWETFARAIEAAHGIKGEA